MENNLIVLDASVVVKWFHEEPDSREAELLQESIAKGELRVVVPPLLFYEVANALTFKAGSAVEQVLAAHKILTSLPFQVVEVIYTILEDAIRIADHHHISVYDAIYVALAISVEASLVTADEKLAKLVGTPTIQLLSEFKTN